MTSANYLNYISDKEKEILWCDYGNKETAGRVRCDMIFTPKRGSVSKNTKESPKTSVSVVFMCILQFSSSICSRVGGTVRVGALKRLYSIDLSLKEGLGG